MAGDAQPKSTDGRNLAVAQDQPISDARSRKRGVKIAEVIAKELATTITESQLAPGSRLPREKEMAEAYGVGRNTLREALRLLETRGVLTIRAGPTGGPVVRRPEPADLGSALSLMLQFRHATFLDVLAARETIEPAVTRLAAEQIVDSELQELRELNALMVKLGSESSDAYFDYNYRFHSGIARACKSVVVEILTLTLMSIADSRILGINYSPRQRQATGVAHDRIVTAFAAHDADAAEQAMRDHLREARTAWTRKFNDLVSRPVTWTQ